METALHPFEKAGLGKAPFRLTGLSEKVCSGVPNDQGIIIGYAGQPAGTCDYCAQGIRYCCHIQSSDGKKFIVGCDCVRKLDREDNALVASVDRAKKSLDRARAAEKRKAKIAAENERIEAAAGYLEACRAALSSKAHPMIAGKTLADYCDWLLANAGQSGRLRAAKIIEDEIETTLKKFAIA